MDGSAPTPETESMPSQTSGARRCRAALLRVDAARMDVDGIRFYRSRNGVWLVDEVPGRYLSGPVRR